MKASSSSADADPAATASALKERITAAAILAIVFIIIELRSIGGGRG